MNSLNPIEMIFTGPGPYAGQRDVIAMNNALRNQPSGPWRSHGQVWTAAGQKLGQASQELDQAFRNITVWRQSTGSDAWRVFERDVTASVNWLSAWSQLAGNVATRLTGAADGLDNARGPMDHLEQLYRQAQDQARSSDAGVAAVGRQNLETVGLQAAFQMNMLSTMLSTALDGVQAAVGEKKDWPGPVVAKDSTDGAAGVPPDGGGTGDGTGAGNGGGAGVGNGGGPGEQPATTPADSPKAPEETTPTDPVEEAGKLIDVVGKGIDLIGKVPENLNKWLTLAQSAQDLLGPEVKTPELDPKDLLPDGPVPDGSGIGSPILAGDYGTAPIFEPAGYVQPGATTGSGVGGLPSVSSPPGLGGIDPAKVGGRPIGTTDRAVPPSSKGTTTAAGGPGSAPALAGQTATSSSAGQQSSSPMYPPPMGGGMGAGGNGGRGEVKSGAAPSRPGFSVPTEQTEAERLRRHGVQSELQGRANGEQSTGSGSGAPPARKRKRDVRGGKTTERDVLDEELWRL